MLNHNELRTGAAHRNVLNIAAFVKQPKQQVAALVISQILHLSSYLSEKL